MDHEGTIRETDDWQRWAVYWSPTKLRNTVSLRVEEATQKQSLVSFNAWITPSAKGDFDRAQTLASRKAKKKLTRGATLAVVFRDYVARHDPQEKTPRKRRIGDTSSRDCRTVPAEVEHEIRKRGPGAPRQPWERIGAACRAARRTCSSSARTSGPSATAATRREAASASSAVCTT